jgi:hypothetical protein
MRKRLIPPPQDPNLAVEDDWLDLERLTTVEVTSEDVAHPIEAALLPESPERAEGWRAAGPGAQTVRVRFDAPQALRRIWLHIVEPAVERTQEFVLRWSSDPGQSFREVVRQQWHFSPHGATDEVEDYRVDLAGVTVLELAITPDIGGGHAPASLRQLRLA